MPSAADRLAHVRPGHPPKSLQNPETEPTVAGTARAPGPDLGSTVALLR